MAPLEHHVHRLPRPRKSQRLVERAPLLLGGRCRLPLAKHTAETARVQQPLRLTDHALRNDTGRDRVRRSVASDHQPTRRPGQRAPTQSDPHWCCQSDNSRRASSARGSTRQMRPPAGRLLGVQPTRRTRQQAVRYRGKPKPKNRPQVATLARNAIKPAMGLFLARTSKCTIVLELFFVTRMSALGQRGEGAKGKGTKGQGGKAGRRGEGEKGTGGAGRGVWANGGRDTEY